MNKRFAMRSSSPASYLAAAILALFSCAARAQCPETAWFPWAYSVDINDPVANEPITAERGLDRLKKVELWSPEGEGLVLQLFASGVFDGVLNKFAKHASSKPRDAGVQAKHGMLLTHAAYSAEEEEDNTSLSAKADKLFDRASEIDQYNWEAWAGKAALYVLRRD